MKCDLVFRLVIIVMLASPGTLMAGEPAQPNSKTRYTASSSARAVNTASYGPENVFDGDPATAWCPLREGAAVGESVAVYLGNAALMGGPQDIVFTIHRGHQKSLRTYDGNWRPSRVNVEVFADNYLLASTEGALEYSIADITLKKVPPATGALWMKVTILASERGQPTANACIAEIRPNFKSANPHSTREFARRICDMLNNPRLGETNAKLKALVRRIKKHFVNPLGSHPVTECSMEGFALVSESDFEMQGFFEGDAMLVLRFRQSGIVWKLLKDGWFAILD
jgi:hypothetical protein